MPMDLSALWADAGTRERLRALADGAGRRSGAGGG